jgi:hypothetical protein
MDKETFTQRQVEFRLAKINQLQREMQQKKTAAEKRAWKEENELHSVLDRLQIQIDLHRMKIRELSPIHFDDGT